MELNKALFVEVTIAVALIAVSEWKKVRKLSGKEKTVFVLLLLSAWIMTFFNLPYTPGLSTVFEALFWPFRPLVEQ